MYAETEMLPVAERQQPFDGPVPHEFVRIVVFPFVAGRRGQQRDDTLAGIDGGAVNRVGPPYRSGEPLRRGAVPMISSRATGTLPSRSERTAANWSGCRSSCHSPVAVIFGTVSVPPMNTPSICTAASMSPKADPSGSRKSIRASAMGTLPSWLAARRCSMIGGEVGQVAGAGVADLDPLPGLREAARVDRRQHLRRQIGW